jgi:lipoprotein NlpD
MRIRSLSLPTIALLLLSLMLAACSSTRPRAPVEERTLPRAKVTAPAAPPPQAAASAPAGSEGKPPPGAENAGKPGYYTVRPGDTLIRIGLENGQNWRDIRRWNNLDDPNRIEVGQVLRVVAPEVDANAVAARGVTPAQVESRPLDANPAAAASAPAATASAVAASAPVSAAAAPPDDGIAWQWPASGALAATFEDGKSKGIDILGKAGDPVVAAADGRVVYAGSGLRGYGNLVIIKHSANFLTAYAHNQTLLVKEDQVVRRGQKIAEMGSSDADRVQLHFEIRRQGRPVDPLKYLPAR